VNSTDLVQAAERIAFRQLLPILVRRLIRATNNGITALEMRGDEGIAAPGFDGTVHSTEAHIYVPLGDSVWEMGANEDPRKKANEDYNARIGTSSPLNASERLAKAFVFVTPRRWSRKTTWVAEKQRLRQWRDVRAFDADDLHTWLEQAPGVHYWLSQELGKVTEGVQSIDVFFKEWSAATNPPITPDLIATGPRALIQDVQEWIRSTKSTKEVSFLSRENGLAMIAAAFSLLEGAEKDDVLGRTLVVTSPTAWNELRRQDAPLILIPSFPGLTSEMLHVHPGSRWIRPKGRDEDPRSKDQYGWEENGEKFRQALVGLGLPEGEAQRLLPVAKKSFTAFRRRLAVYPSLLRPRWAMPEEGRKLLAPLLVGKWIDGRPEDLGVVTGLAELPWKTLADALIPWTFQEDPPWVSVGSGWYPVDRGDVWTLLAPYLTESDLSSFCEVAVEVLSRPHPKWLSEGSSFVSTPQTRQTSLSDDLVRGIASIVACMGVEEELRPLSFTRFPEWASRILIDWFERGGKDWRVWAYHSEEWNLSLLAEVNPGVFLREFHQVLEAHEESFQNLFRSRGVGSYATPPLSGLLASLKMLSMWPEHLEAVTTILLRLCTWTLDKTSGSNPRNALLDIYRSWYPITNATLTEQVSILRRSAKRQPKLVAELLLSLQPSHHDIAMEPPRTKWRKAAARGGVTMGELNAAYRAFLDLYMELCATEPRNVVRLIPSVGVAPRWEEKDQMILEFLGRQDFGLWMPEGREELRQQVFKLLTHYLPEGQAEPAAWAVLRGIAEQCAPSDPVAKWKWLFARTPPLRFRGMDTHAVLVAQRTLALEEIWNSEAWEGIERMLQVSDEPGFVGVALASLDEASEHAWQYLLAKNFLADKTLRGLFRGLVVGALQLHGDRAREWEEKTRRRLVGRTIEEQAEFELMLRYDAQRVRDLAPDVKRVYWEGFSFWGLRGIFHWEVIEGLLSVNRCYAAIEALSLYSEEVPPEHFKELALEAFRILLEMEPTEVEGGDLHHNIGDLVGCLRGIPDFPEDILLQLDLRYIQSYEWTPLTLFKELGRSPQLFVQAVRAAFLPRGVERKELAKEEIRAATMGYEVLSKWAGAPGWKRDGAIDVDAGLLWVGEMEKAFEDDPEWLDIAYRRIGEAMGRFTKDHQPVPEICLLIERIGKADLDEGFELGLFNSRGAVFGSGGESDRSQADKFDHLAETLAEYPRVSAIYRRMAAQYMRMAQRRDDENEAQSASYDT
jgi:hypothetical protein